MLNSVLCFYRHKKGYKKFVFSKTPRPRPLNYFDEFKYHRIYIRNNSKTLFFTLVDHTGKVLCAFSSGMVGLKGSKRLGTPAVDLLSRKISFFAKQLNIKIISVILKVTNHLFNVTALKIFSESGFEIGKIVELVPISHNGRRSKKLRRI